MAINRERKLVPSEECSFYFERKLSEVLIEVKKLIKEYGPDAYIDGCTDPYSNSDRESFYVFTMQPENDQQYNKRIEQEEQMEKYREAHDAEEFKRLQAKFGAK
jgi:hypothetical protein